MRASVGKPYLPPARDDESREDENQQPIEQMDDEIRQLESERVEAPAGQIIVQGQGDLGEAPPWIVGLTRIGGAQKFARSHRFDPERVVANDAFYAVENEYALQSGNIGEHGDAGQCSEQQRDGQRFEPRLQ